jgi:hypothetical protein
VHLNFSIASWPLVLNGMPAYSSIGSLTLAVSGNQTSALGAGSLLPQAKRLMVLMPRIVLLRLRRMGIDFCLEIAEKSNIAEFGED